MKEIFKTILDSKIGAFLIAIFGFVASVILWSINPLLAIAFFFILAIAFFFTVTYFLFRELEKKWKK